MMIGFATINYSLTGHLVLDADMDSNLGQTSRRVSRRATLDGGATITDDGFSHADRTFAITSNTPMSPAELEILKSLHRDYALVNCFTPDGVFQGVIDRLNVLSSGAWSLSFLVKTKLSA